MAHRPGPAAGHVVDIDITLLDDLQRRDQLAFEKRAAPPVKGQCRQRLDHMERAAFGAIGAFQPPDGHHNRFVHAIGRLDLFQQRAVGRQRRLTVGDAFIRRGRVQIIPDRLGEFRLIAILVNHIGAVADGPHRPVEHVGRDTGGQRARAKGGDPTAHSRGFRRKGLHLSPPAR